MIKKFQCSGLPKLTCPVDRKIFPLRVRFSLDNLKLDHDVLNIPLFMADHTERLIGLALEQKKKSITMP